MNLNMRPSLEPGREDPGPMHTVRRHSLTKRDEPPPEEDYRGLCGTDLQDNETCNSTICSHPLLAAIMSTAETGENNKISRSC